jgi:hypothetical protein
MEFPVHARIGLKDLKSAFAARMALCPKPQCVLVRIHGLSLITDEAVEFWKSSQVSETLIAEAVVVNIKKGFYKRSKQILWLMKNIDKPEFPFDFFDNEDSALEWLSKYCNDPE